MKQLELSLNYTFKNILLLKQALTHKSFGKTNYERLEFVGDGILDYAIALILFNTYPNLPEGELSKIRAALVNQRILASLADKIKLGNYLYLGEGEERSDGRERASILADSMEAIFAAISFDSSFDDAFKVIKHLYKDKLVGADKLLNRDSKSTLQEYLQAKKIAVPSYNVVEVTGPDHNSMFKVECVIDKLKLQTSSYGKTKKEASQGAAQEMLKIIKRNSHGK